MGVLRFVGSKSIQVWCFFRGKVVIFLVSSYFSDFLEACLS